MLLEGILSSNGMYFGYVWRWKKFPMQNFVEYFALSFVRKEGRIKKRLAKYF